MDNNTVVVVTGATRGIGRAIAEELSNRGYRVYGTGRSSIKNTKTAFTLIAMDVTNTASVNRGIKRILTEEGHIDILINNAGISHCSSVEETPLEMVNSIFETNYIGILRTLQAVLPGMRSRRQGIIVNIGSLAGKIGIPFQSHYSSSKFAVEGLTESLMHELRPFGIRIILVEPGDVGTNIWESSEKILRRNSPYNEQISRFLNVKQKEMSGSADPPEKVAHQIVGIIEKTRRGFRFPVAKGSRLIAIARKILPDSVFLRLIARNYDL